MVVLFMCQWSLGNVKFLWTVCITTNPNVDTNDPVEFVTEILISVILSAIGFCARVLKQTI
jgi:hypothetical protein